MYIVIASAPSRVDSASHRVDSRTDPRGFSIASRGLRDSSRSYSLHLLRIHIDIILILRCKGKKKIPFVVHKWDVI